MEKVKHTPTPWHIEKINGFQIACADETNPDYVAEVYNEANAAFIVKACNMHDDLVELLEYFHGFAVLNDDCEDEKFTALLSTAQALINRIKEQ